MNTPKRLSRNDLQLMVPKGTNQILVDLGCGERKKHGHLGVDFVKLAGVDIACDINQGLPFEDNSVDGIYSNFLFEHVANTIFLFQEIYRVCKNTAVVEFRVPYYQSVTQFKDPTHKAAIPPEMMRYFSSNKWYGSDYGINTNFVLVGITYEYLPPFNHFQSKWIFFLWPITYPALLFSRRFLWNVVHSVTMKLKVVK